MNKPVGWIFAAAAAALVGWAALSPALARPPTVGINPGYDRRLTESRRQQGSDLVAPPSHRKHYRHRR
jgi:hypothetical protein